MNRANPVVVAAWRGLMRSGPAHQEFLGTLLLQCVVLAIAWPKSSLYFTLLGQDGPNTLLAALLAAATALSYAAMRHGAEESLLPDQPSLLEWAVLPRTSTRQLVAGHLQAQCLVATYRLALSAPLLTLALIITPGALGNFAVAVLNILLLAVAFGIAAAALYVQFGTRGTLVYLGLRIGFLALVLLPALLWGDASIVVQTYLMFVAPEPGTALEPTLGGWFEQTGLSQHTGPVNAGGIHLLLWHSLLLIVSAIWLSRALGGFRGAMTEQGE